MNNADIMRNLINETKELEKNMLNEERLGEVANYKGNTILIKTYFMNDEKDKSFIKENLDTIWNILQEGYKRLGGWKGIQGKSEFTKKVSLVKLGFYNDEIVAVDVCNDYMGGNKSIGVTCVKGEKHEAGVLLVEMIIRENIHRWNDYVWSMVSGRVEEIYKKLNGYNVKTKYLDIYLGAKKAEPLDDGYHFITKVQGKDETKTIFGIKNKDAIEQMMMEDFDTLTSFLKDSEEGFVNENRPHNDYFKKRHPIEIAISIIYAFEDYKENYLYNEFPEKLYEKLRLNVKFVEDSIKKGKCPDELLHRAENAVSDGKRVLSTTVPLTYMTF